MHYAQTFGKGDKYYYIIFHWVDLRMELIKESKDNQVILITLE